MDSAVRRLADEFGSLLDQVRENIARTAQIERDASLEALEETQDLLKSAEEAHRQLSETVANYKQFERQLAQLEQIYLISEDLKDVIRRLESASKK